MAYISAEDTKLIRQALKKVFPQFKFSVRNDRHTAIQVTILSGPVKFVDSDYSQLNQYYPENYNNSDILKQIIHIVNTGGTRPNYDNSDIMTDYFDVGYYVSINQGSWDKPYVCVAKNKAA